MKIEPLCKFIEAWQAKIHGVALDSEQLINNFCNVIKLSDIYDHYYQAVSEMKMDVYGNRVDRIEVQPIEHVLCTYAGGLGPHNIKKQLEEIEKIVGDREIAVDMETHVRSHSDTVFDLEKVRFCLKHIAKYV